MKENPEQEKNDWKILVALAVGWGILRLAARTLAKVFVGNTGTAVSSVVAQGHGLETAGLAAPAAPQTGRDADRDIDLEPGSNRLNHLHRGTLVAILAFAVAFAGGVGFLVAYWSAGSNLLLGGTLALFLGGVGAGLVLWEHGLMRHRQAIEPREKLPSSAAERDALDEDFRAGEHEVQRRGLLRWMIAGGMGILAAGMISLLRSLGRPPGPSLFDTAWSRGQRLVTMEGQPISLNTLQPGSAMTVFPENSIGAENAQTVLIRVNPQYLQLPEDRANWAPMGYVAYSRVCTHAGCPVGLFEAHTDLLLCPCHQSTFNVLRGAQPTSGPAARPLPQLPLYADGDGNLRAGGGFSEPPGPGFWGMP
ncbi:MAG: Rieske 2Fe-2S domain-containing protein [Candidatus Sulfotelmatobacter sp.]